MSEGDSLIVEPGPVLVREPARPTGWRAAMPDWVNALTFGKIAFGVWSLFAMFVIAAQLFGFDPVVEALGGLFDRIGLEGNEQAVTTTRGAQP